MSRTKKNREKSGKEDGARNEAVGAAMNDQEATNSSEDDEMVRAVDAHEERMKQANNNNRQGGTKVKIEWY